MATRMIATDAAMIKPLFSVSQCVACWLIAPRSGALLPKFVPGSDPAVILAG